MGTYHQYAPTSCVAHPAHLSDFRFGIQCATRSYGETLEIPPAPPGELRTVELENLEPDRRYVLRLRAEENGTEFLGGDFRVFTR